MDAARIIAETLDAELGIVRDPDGDPEAPSPLGYKTAQAVLFALGKNGIRLIEPGDVLEREDDKDAGTVKVLLKADE